jgi:RNA polymerase sigma-70 factor (ECF subfamily)
MQCEATRLMLAAKRGDRQAFDTLVEHLRSRACHVARALVGSHDDAMELSQEAFLKVYRARETFRDGEPFLPWFHRILRNTCFTYLRDNKRAKSLTAASNEDGEDFDFEIVDDESAPGETLLADERTRSFWKAFRSLGARDREILALRHFKELSYKDIAASLSVPEGTVMSRLFHARRRLREKLDPDVFSPEETGLEAGGNR